MRRGSDWRSEDPSRVGPAACVVAAILAAINIGLAAGAEFQVGPDDFRARVTRLLPGDTLLLAPGEYRHALPIHGLLGRPDRPITIRGIDPLRPPRFIARPGANTVSIIDSAHVIVSDLLLDGRGIAVDGVKAEGHAHFAHHITLERLLILGYGADQQNVAISTKCPAWHWVVRSNVIDGAGTGMYFGNSDGSDPFVGGIIEGNTIRNTIGYNLQIKHQSKRLDGADLPTEPQTTVVRRNRFEKGRNSSRGIMARPNVLFGHLPLTGFGSEDRYLVYGNVFDTNPDEALLQAEGNIFVYNNLFVNLEGDAIRVQPHNHLPRSVAVFSNTVIAASTGISMVGGEAGFDQVVFGNAVFAESPVPAGAEADNFVAPLARRSVMLRRPEATSEARSFAPMPGALRGAPLLPPRLTVLPEATLDLEAHKRTTDVYGACNPSAERCR